MKRCVVAGMLLVLVGLVAIGAKSVVGVEGDAQSQLDPSLAEKAARLRANGPQALDALFTQRSALENQLAGAQTDEVRLALEAQLAENARLIDLVGGQHYCTASKLFWYTDLDAAQAESKRTGKPILSLRMLGKLTDELSCANSRFFRTTLYANAEISQLLRDRYILHWKSVRPVPVITVDFGDGRKLVRTVTGNSAHYVLDSRGKTLDALPGLYGPQAFRQWLLRCEELAEQVLVAKTEESKLAVLHQYHNNRAAAIQQQWNADVAALRQADQPRSNAAQVRSPGWEDAVRQALAKAQADQQVVAQAVPAELAARVAVPKSVGEIAVVQMITLNRNQLEEATDDNLWQRIAQLHREEATLDQASRELIASENPTARDASPLTVSKALIEDPLLKLVGQFEASVALDSVRNEYLLHYQIHNWFTDGQVQDVEQLNDRVYAELFLTPKSDPWLGLVAENVYTALHNSGVVRNAGQQE